MDLVALGALLRERRESLGWSREELASRMPHSAAYIFLIERAHPRRGGSPSRPRRNTLVQWAYALQMDTQSTDRVLALAGYPPQEVGLPYAAIPHEAASLYAAIPPTHSAFEPERERLVGQLHEVLNMARLAGTWGETVGTIARVLDEQTAALERILDEGDGREDVLKEVSTLLDTARATPHWDRTIDRVRRLMSELTEELATDANRG